MSRQDCITMCCHQLDLGLREDQVNYCYGMSKMTVAKENDIGPEKYNKIDFVEMVEFICRLADVKFKDSEMEEIALA